MNYQLILLGKNASVDKISKFNAVCFHLEEGHKESPRHLGWPSGYGGQLLSRLVKEARKALWCEEIDQIFARYEPCRQSSLSFSPEQLKGTDFETLAGSKIHREASREEENILRTVQSAASKILKRKVIFVFPNEWPKKFNRYLKEMAAEVCTYFSEAPLEQGLPWAFLEHGEWIVSSNGDGTDKSEMSRPFRSFIELIHGKMLEEKDEVDRLKRWKNKKGTILLAGPTGSGKSYSAKILASEYGQKMIEVNLAAISESLIESRMRGHEKGAFTDAKTATKGWFEEADKGVLFLDEFQSTPLSFQTQLLDVLNAVSDDVYIAPIGKDSDRKHFSVKIVIAINEDIELLLAQKRLRKDILYRVRHIEQFPSLSDRLKRDKEHRYLRGLLATYRWKSFDFASAKQFSVDVLSNIFPAFSDDALIELVHNDWPGNFRELERVAFDIFYECDYLNGSKIITAERVKAIIESWSTNTKVSFSTELEQSGLSPAEQRKLNEIQSAILKCKFIFADVINGEHQCYYRSRQALKQYLAENKHLLDPVILNDSRMKMFIGIS